MNIMVRQIVKSIPKYPFKMSSTNTFTDTANNATTIVTGEYVLSTKMLVGDFRLSEISHYFIRFDHINVDGKTLHFTEPIAANVTYQDKAYFCRNEDLDIATVSTKLEDCIKDFNEEILFVWKEYGKEDDDKLTDDAKILKRKILQHVNK